MRRLRPFAYPSTPHRRKHGPSGYKNYQEYKDWAEATMLPTTLQNYGPFATVGADSDGKWTAEVVGLPEISVTGDSREQTLEQVQRLLQERLASGELVPLSLTNPLVEQAGWAKDDPTYQAFLDELRNCRLELDRDAASRTLWHGLLTMSRM